MLDQASIPGILILIAYFIGLPLLAAWLLPRAIAALIRQVRDLVDRQD